MVFQKKRFWEKLLFMADSSAYGWGIGSKGENLYEQKE